MATPRTRNATELTDEHIEALADEAERGYDLTTARGAPCGDHFRPGVSRR